MHNVNVEIGKRYGLLTVSSLLPERDKWGYRLFECDCDCGGHKIVRSVNLTNGYTKSCGCLWSANGKKYIKKFAGKNKKAFGESSFTLLYHRYKIGAKQGKMEFSLTKDQFRKLVTGDCIYCGSPPNRIILRKTPKGNTAFGHFVYNGIDRVDTSKGYMPENSVSCCRQCNVAKSAYSLDEFKEWIKRVHAKLIGS